MRRFGLVLMAFGAIVALDACAAMTTGETGINDGSATLHATASCDANQSCTWYWEYWPADGPRSNSARTPVQGPVSGPTGTRDLSARITGLSPNTTYRWVFCASPNHGVSYACAGPHGTFGSTTADPPPDYATFTTAYPGTLAESWNGSTWRLQTTPNPSGATSSALQGVSCPSASACTAVGAYNAGTTQSTLAEAWDGTSWTIQPTPGQGNESLDELLGVSCTSATACTGVGIDASTALAERWDGTSWTSQPTSTPPGSSDSGFEGVSCSSGSACTAVGLFLPPSGGSGALAEGWNGTGWMIQTLPQPSEPFLDAVSCTSPAACTAVGPNNTGGTLAERWNGTSWTTQTTPNPTGGTARLNGVSCTSATACTAVGSYDNSGGFLVTLAEHWDGVSWTIQPTPNPSASQGGSLAAVSCTSLTACTPAGTDGAGGTLAERWDGTSWTIQPTPDIGSTRAALDGVSCSSSTQCTAVGTE